MHAWMYEHEDALTSSSKVHCRKLMLSSMAGVVIALLLLGYAFHLAEGDSPQVTPGASTTCPAPDCAACLHQVCTCSAHAYSLSTLSCQNRFCTWSQSALADFFLPLFFSFYLTHICFGFTGLALPFILSLPLAVPNSPRWSASSLCLQQTAFADIVLILTTCLASCLCPCRHLRWSCITECLHRTALTKHT